MKKLSAQLLIVIMVVTLMVSGCGKPATVSNDKKTAPNPIKVGLIVPLTGGAADTGIPVKQAAELAVKEFNQKGGLNGRMVELIGMDDENNPDKGVNLVQKMIQNDKVCAIIGPAGTAVALATEKVTQEAKIPQIVSGAQDPRIMDPIHPYTFRTTETFVDDAKKIVQFLKAQGYKKPALLHDSQASGLGGKAVILPLLEQAGMPAITVVSHDVGVKDLTAQVLSLQKAKPDVIITWNLGAEAALFAKTLKQVGWDIQIVGHRGLAHPILIKLGGSAVEGWILSDAIDDTKANTKEFLDKFEKEYKVRPNQNAFASLGWDATQVFLKALVTANSDDPAKLRDAIEGIKNFEPVAGKKGATISFSPTKHEGPDGEYTVMRKVQGGNYVTVPEK